LVIAVSLFILIPGLRGVYFASRQGKQNYLQSIWGLCDLVLVLGIVVLGFLMFFSIKLAVLFFFSFVIFLYRELKNKANTRNPLSIFNTVKLEVKRTAFGYVLVAALSTSLIGLVAGASELAKLASWSYPISNLFMILILAIGVCLVIGFLKLMESKSPARDFLPLALFLVIVGAIIFLHAFARISPGLSGFYALLCGLFFVAVVAFFNDDRDDGRPGRNRGHAALIEIVDWFSLAGRNAAPVVVLGAITGLFIGTITLTNVGVQVLDLFF